MILLEQTKKILKTAKDSQAAFEELETLGIVELIQMSMGAHITSIEDIENIGGPVDVLSPPAVSPAEEAALNTGFLEHEHRGGRLSAENDDKAAVVNTGGIDMNDISVTNQGDGSYIQFDPVAVTDTAIRGFSPVIISMTPVDDILPLLGFK